jgi:tetratricopeptide (TPR) repeat protein
MGRPRRRPAGSRGQAPVPTGGSVGVRLWPLLGLLAAVLAVKLVVAAQLGGYPLLQPIGGLDTAVYVELARKVAAGDWLLGPGAYYVSPLYIYFLALCLAMSGGALMAVRVIQAVLGTAAVGLVFLTARAWFGERAAWVAAGLAALTGLLTFYEVVVLQASLEPILTALELYALTRAFRSGRLAWYAAAGAAIGLHALNRPNLLLWGVALLVLLLISRGLSRHPIARAAAVAAGLVAALAPIAARNLAVTGQASVLPSHGGLNLYVGNNPRADGTYHTVPGITPDIDGQAEDARRVAEAALRRPMSDGEVSAYFVGLALDWIAANPVPAAALFARKLYYVFQRAVIPLNYSYAYYTREVPSLLPVLFIGPWLLVPLGLVGLVQGVRHLNPDPQVPGPECRRNYWLWCAFVPVYAVSVAVFFVATRYRLPLLVPLAIGSGAAVDRMLAWRADRPPMRTAGVVCLSLLALAAAVNWPIGLDDGRGNERTWLAITLITEGRYDEARALADRTEPIHPYPGVMRYRLGQAYRRVGQRDLAIREFERSLMIDPRQPETDLALGEVLLDAGRAAEAVPYLRAAFEANLRPDLSGYALARALRATGDRAGSVEVLDHLAATLDVEATSFVALGDLALESGAPAVAGTLYRRAIARAPAMAGAHEKLGVALSMEGHSAEAIRALEDACRLDTASASARLNLAVAYATAGRLNEARARAQDALRLDPGYERARAFLAALER